MFFLKFPAITFCIHLCVSILLFYSDITYAKDFASPEARYQALKKHPSPYLRSHSDDPIHWQIISSGLLKNAKKSKQLILISSGYQSCYWCYRMKRDTFSNKKLAQVINDSFVPVLIDREIETTIDQQLQQFMEEQRGFGGWPLTMILTPDGDPVVGFSYTSATSLMASLNKLLEQWKTDPEKVTALAKAATKARIKNHQRQEQLLERPDYQKLLMNFLQQISTTSDDQYGGFGDKEKFPNIAQLNAILDIYGLNPDASLGQFIQFTLDNMLAGSLHDQLSGGFFRYSGNRDWSAPHYEQMLYTQALMGKLLIRAGQYFKKPEYIRAGIETLANMHTQFIDKKGEEKGLYHASISAVSGGDKQQAGGYYLWTPAQLKDLVGKDWQTAIENLSSDVSTADSAKNILPKPIGKNSAHITALLLKKRNERPAPNYDNKKLLAWHGLVLTGLAYGAQLSPELANAARLLATQLLNRIAQDELQNLMGVSGQEAGVVSMDNLVYVAQGLLDWWQVSGDSKALASAEKLLLEAHQRFYKEGRWLQSDPYDLFASLPTHAIKDSQLPSPSAIWLSLAWALSDLNKQSSLKAKADHVGRQLPQSLQNEAFFHSTLISTVIARQWHLRNNRNGPK